MLDKLRAASNDQLQTTFEGTAFATESACNRSLRQFFDAEYVDRVWVLVPRDGYDGYKELFVNVLDAKGRNVVKTHLDQFEETPHYQTRHRPTALRPYIHPYAITDFYCQLRVACRGQQHQLWGWQDDKDLASLRLRGELHSPHIPDAFFVANAKPHFLEVDMGTESIISYTDRNDWVKKIEDYGSYLDGYDAWYYSDFPDLASPVVLIVTISNERATHILGAIGKARGQGAYWVSTMQAVKKDFWGSHWRVVGEDAPRSLLSRLGPCLSGRP